jgi:hypothetical protein
VLSDYRSEDCGRRTEALRTIAHWDSSHVPELRQILAEQDKSHTAVLAALARMKCPESMELLISVLGGEIEGNKRIAAAGVWERLVIESRGTSADTPSATLKRAVTRYLQESSDYPDLQYGLKIAALLRCQECVPTLRKLENHDDFTVRAMAGLALSACGKVRSHGPASTATTAGAGRWLPSIAGKMTPQRALITCAAVDWVNEQPTLIVACEEQSSDTDVWEIRESRDRGETVLFRLPVFAWKMIVRDASSSSDETPWMVTLGRRARHCFDGDVAVAFDRSGRELWKTTPPAGTTQLRDIAWLYGPSGPSGIILMCDRRDGHGAMIGLDLRGRELWHRPGVLFPHEVISSGCVPSVLLARAGLGTGLVMNQLGEQTATIRDESLMDAADGLVLLPTPGGDFWIAVSQYGKDSVGWLASLDSELSVHSRVQLDWPLLGMAPVVSSCSEKSGVASLLMSGELRVTDSAGTTQGSIQIWPEVDRMWARCPAPKIGSGRTPRGGAVVAVVLEQEAVLIRYTSSDRTVTAPRGSSKN